MRNEHLRGTPASRVLIVACSFLAASIGGLVAMRILPSSIADVAAVSATWIALYPIARINRREPWWAHWARGVFVVIGFSLALRFFR